MFYLKKTQSIFLKVRKIYKSHIFFKKLFRKLTLKKADFTRKTVLSILSKVRALDKTEMRIDNKYLVYISHTLIHTERLVWFHFEQRFLVYRIYAISHIDYLLTKK